MLKHAAEISLQRFHREQVKGNNVLTEEQLYAVINGAYNFLVTMPKNRHVVKMIFERISKDGGLTYGGFLGWVNEALAKRWK